MKKSKSAENAEDVEKKTTDENVQDENIQSVEASANESQNKEDKDGIRRIIKLGPEKNNEENTETRDAAGSEEASVENMKQMEDSGSSGNVDEQGEKKVESTSAVVSEQNQQVLLQNLKDFDFQLKKNQEEIKNLSEKVESISKDLD
ncbi:MAG TPA: hypothetical protein ENI42_01535, partial [Thermoplasmatales archaeon]|nr:hypothetical protein [Thermoplasmatales archaeon]